MELWTPEEKLNYVYAFMKYDHKDIELDFWQDDFIRNRNRFYYESFAFYFLA